VSWGREYFEGLGRGFGEDYDGFDADSDGSDSIGDDRGGDCYDDRGGHHDVRGDQGGVDDDYRRDDLNGEDARVLLYDDQQYHSEGCGTSFGGFVFDNFSKTKPCSLRNCYSQQLMHHHS